MWKLEDIPVPGGPDGRGPLLNPTGKASNYIPIDSVNSAIDGTIASKALHYPSFECVERARFQNQVFGHSHRLPTCGQR